ncbi:MAG: serine/threonine protein kinase [Anaerolineales bacterium]|nr:serine/threonine protein kinase [Anaerolineales bacterium]
MDEEIRLLKDGQVIGQSYTIERFLGEGAFAEVYRVRHRFLGRQAMKVFKATGMSIEEIEQMLQEAVLLSQIHHRNIIQVFDANIAETSKGLCGYFTMEYLAGGSLDHHWKSFGLKLMPVENAVDIVRQASRGIAVGHSEKPPIVHRDIKPQNMLIGYDAGGMRVCVSDFGLAKRANPMTLMVSAKGTRVFKAPETFKDYQKDSCMGDVWALGCTLYLLLTDRFPFGDPGQASLVDDFNFDQPLIPPSQLNIQVDPGLDQIVCRCLAIHPKNRYPSAIQLLADLEKWKPVEPGSISPAKMVITETNKDALGPVSSPNQSEARGMVEKALKLARRADRLSEAADLMEEAFNKWPDLREEYEWQVTLWRRGVMTVAMPPDRNASNK